MELMDCPNLAVPNDVMQHVVRIESSYNPYAIGVVGGRLARQPRNLAEAVATARMLESRGFNFSVGLTQVNRHNLARQGLASYERAFDACLNLQAGSRILAECHGRSGGDWGKSFSCYYSGNFTTGFRHGYVQKIYASMRDNAASTAVAIDVIGQPMRKNGAAANRSRFTSAVAPITGRRTSLSHARAAPSAASDGGGEGDSLPAAPAPSEGAVNAPPREGQGDHAFVF